MKRYIVLLSLILQTIIMADTQEEVYNKIRQEAEALDSMVTKCEQKDMSSCKDVGLYWNKAEDFELAFYYFKKACDGNNSVGCGFVGIYKYSGREIPKNKISIAKNITIDRLLGLQYLEKSCNNGFSDACTVFEKAQKNLKEIWLGNIKDQNIQIICDSKNGETEFSKEVAWATMNTPMIQNYENFFERNCKARRR